jgi:hypothetical protein
VPSEGFVPGRVAGNPPAVGNTGDPGGNRPVGCDDSRPDGGLPGFPVCCGCCDRSRPDGRVGATVPGCGCGGGGGGDRAGFGSAGSLDLGGDRRGGCDRFRPDRRLPRFPPGSIARTLIPAGDRRPRSETVDERSSDPPALAPPAARCQHASRHGPGPVNVDGGTSRRFARVPVRSGARCAGTRRRP